MPIYRIQYSIGPEIGSTYPQSQEIHSEIDIWDPNNFYSRQRGYVDKSVYIPESILDRKAKLTDMVSSSPIMLPIISTKLKDIFESYRTDGVQYLPTKLAVGSTKHDYWILNGYTNDFQLIDFEKSVIVVKNEVEQYANTLELSSAAGLEMAIESTKYPAFVRIQELVLKGPTPDLFFIDRTKDGRIFVSEKLKNVIEAAGCTGITFEAL